MAACSKKARTELPPSDQIPHRASSCLIPHIIPHLFQEQAGSRTLDVLFHTCGLVASQNPDQALHRRADVGGTDETGEDGNGLPDARLRGCGCGTSYLHTWHHIRVSRTRANKRSRPHGMTSSPTSIPGPMTPPSSCASHSPAGSCRWSCRGR